MRKQYLIGIFILLHLFAITQEVIPVKISYSEILTQNTRQSELNYITFNGAQNLFKFGALPLYYCEVDLPSKYFGCEIEIEEFLSDTLTKYRSYILNDNDLVESNFDYVIKYSETKARIFILPFRWNDSQSEIIRLKEFNLMVDFIPIEIEVNSLAVSRNYASQSVLNSGSWVKMGILNTGIHKLTYTDIENMGFSPSQLDISKIGVFGNYAGLLPEANSKTVLDDLQENSILISGGEDGSFDSDDYILFYAQSATTWSYNPFLGRFSHINNIYADTTFYFFTPDKGTGKTITKIDGVVNNPTQFVSSFSDYASHERDYENMLSTGKEWFGEKFTSDTLEREFSFSFPNLDKNEPVYLGIHLIARSFVDSYYDIYINDELVSDSTKIRFISSSLSVFARKSNKNLTFFSNTDIVNVKIKYYSDDINSLAWLDYIEINAIRELIFNGGQMQFSDPHSSAIGNITRFDISQGKSSDIIWDITDIHNPAEIVYNVEDENVNFTLPTDSIKNFIIFDDSDYYSPVSFDEIRNQNLHEISDVNFVIIRPDKFEVEADILANIHRDQDGLTTICISPQEIYNEFSSGSQDISGIRNFMRMLYKKNAFGEERAYLLLFGDASFDYKHRVHENSNLVPTYESQESLRATGSFVSDDYFGLLDDNEGASASGNLDIGIGRFPISTKEEALSTIAKIEHYINHNEDVMRDWRTNICFVADDKDNNLHLDQAEGLVSIADTLHKGIGINKIFLDAYGKLTVPGGFRYPDVNKKINKQMSEGALILNYTGHGGLIGWSEELVLDVPMINAFENFDNLPLIITATCEFSRFDDPEFTSAGEYVFLNEKGGAIALLTTTRLAYAHANYIVNRRIYTNLLSCDDENNRPRLGDLVRLSKIPSNENYLNFVLLGDPALTLAYPKYNVVTNQSISGNVNVSDTIHALSIVNVSGEIQKTNGQIVNNFNGYVYPKVVDKASLYTTLGNDGNSYPTDFYLFDKILFDGKIRVENGLFEFEFMVPKDIAYNYGYGKIRYYAFDTVNFVDAWGAFDQLYIGGIDENADIDQIGPDIELYLNNNSFKPGDVVTSHPVLLTYLNDEHGINSTGNGLGRDIVMILDGDYSNPTIMNDYFIMDVNSFKAGKIIYPFNELEQGLHTLTIKAWDLQNNSSEKTIEFIVDDASEIKLSQVLNYPNPFYDNTRFEFMDNKHGSVLEAIIRIYDLHGDFIVELTGNSSNGANAPEPINWDGRNSSGAMIAPGIYIYTIEVRDEYNNVTVQQQKLLKINK